MNADAEAVLRDLATTPARLTALSRGKTAAALIARPSKDEWSATEIIAHLRANADTWGSSISKMLEQDVPKIRYVSPRGVMKKPEYAACEFPKALDLFVAARRELIATLTALPAAGWSRAAIFTGTTKTDGNVLSYAQRIAAHEAEHLVQFEALFT